MKTNKELMLACIEKAKQITQAYRDYYNPPGIDLKARNGDDPAPPANESTAETVNALAEHLPSLFNTLNRALIPNEQALVDATRTIAPQQNQLQLDLSLIHI